MPAPAVVATAQRVRQAVVARALRTRRATRARRERERNRTRARVIGYGAAAVVLAIVLPMAAIIVAIAGTRAPQSNLGGVSQAALADIPPEALTAYRDAAQTWQIDWAILAAVGKVECNHGRADLDGCNPPDTMNYAGARGFMQFIGSTWRRGLGQHELEPRSSPAAADGQGYATDGDGDGDADPWSWPDAAHSAARYLATMNVSQDAEAALFGYNRSRAYVSQVLSIADTHRAAEAAAGPGSYSGSAGNVPLATVEGITVHADIADQVGALVRAARADGISLGGGGYRDPAEQIALRRAHCGPSQYAIYEMPSSQCSPPTARPGSSNHERGLAIDFTCNGGSVSRGGSCFSWLSAHAADYGLHNLPSEPWHWSVDGT